MKKSLAQFLTFLTKTGQPEDGAGVNIFPVIKNDLTGPSVAGLTQAALTVVDL